MNYTLAMAQEGTDAAAKDHGESRRFAHRCLQVMRWCVLKENYNLNSMILMLIAASEESIPILGRVQNFAVRIYWPRSRLTRNRICKQVATCPRTWPRFSLMVIIIIVIIMFPICQRTIRGSTLMRVRGCRVESLDIYSS